MLISYSVLLLALISSKLDYFTGKFIGLKGLIDRFVDYGVSTLGSLRQSGVRCFYLCHFRIATSLDLGRHRLNSDIFRFGLAIFKL